MKHRTAALLLALFVLLSLLPGCAGDAEDSNPSPAPSAAVPTPEPSPSPAPPATATPEPEPPQPGVYTLRLSTEDPPRCWNVHNWASETDAFLWTLTTSPLVDIGLEPGEGGNPEDRWLFTMAESVEDITGQWEHAAAWGIGPEESGRVWRIRLNTAARWADEAGTPINADSYLDSMRLLLAPERMNYRTGPFCSGPTELVGAADYLRSGTDTWVENAAESGIAYPYLQWTAGPDGVFRTSDGAALHFSLRSPLTVWLDGNSLEDYYRAGYVPENIFSGLAALADSEGYVPVTEESMRLLYAFTGSDAWGRESKEDLAYYTVYRKSWPVTTWESVGLLKEDEYTLLYICAESAGEYDFLFGLTTPWLVYPPLYEGGSFDFEGRLYTDYGTSPETSMSCGPYRLAALNGEKAVLERNESWFGYGPEDNGLYETDRIELSFLGQTDALARFQAGELDVFSGEAAPGTGASPLWKDDAYVYRFFMVTDRGTLYGLQTQASQNGKRVNKTCLANDAFREALSYAVNRSRLTEAGEESCRPALGVIGDLYLFNAENELGSRYRTSVPGMVALCSAYGINLSSVSDIASLRNAAESCSGYDPAKARRLFQTAAEQMTAAGEWDDGMVIELRCAVGGETLSDGQLLQNRLMQEFLDAATAETDFQGKCSITFVNSPDQYHAVASGEIEMGYGAWGGAAFDPYGLMQCYCDPSFNTIQEGLGFAPNRKLLTLLLRDETITKTYTEWCLSLLEGGEYAQDPDLRLIILSDLEEALLKERRFIVVGQGSTPIWISGRLEPGNRRYSILSGFGGLRSLRYTQDDAQWAARS